MKEKNRGRRFDPTESKRAREIREEKERKERERKNPPPIPLRKIHNYVFYGGVPVRRNGH